MKNKLCSKSATLFYNNVQMRSRRDLLPVYTGYIQIVSGLVDSDWWRTDRADT